MGEYNKKLILKNGSQTKSYKLYTDAKDTGTSANLAMVHNSQRLFVPADDAAAVNGSPNIRFTYKTDGKKYALLTSRKLKTFTVTIRQSANQTIYVVCNGTTYTSSFKAVEGSSFSARVTPAANYDAGSLNVSSGVINNDITIYASAASEISYGGGGMC